MKNTRGSLLVGLLCIASTLTCSHPLAGNAAEAEAISGEPSTTRTASPVFLLMLTQEPVQRDLNLSPLQIEAVASLMDKFTASAREAIAEAKKSHAGAIPPFPKLLGEQSADVEAQVKVIVSDSQFARLKQLHLRAARAWGLFEPETQRRLDLTAETLAEARKILQAGESECRRMAREMRTGSLRTEEALARVDELRRKTHEDVFSLLSPKQHLKLDDLLGRVPNFDPASLRLRLVVTPQASPAEIQADF